MNKMRKISIAITQLLDLGHTPFIISQMMNVPVDQVYAIEEGLIQEDQSPFATINS